MEPLEALRSLENPHSIVTVSLTTNSESAGITAVFSKWQTPKVIFLEFFVSENQHMSEEFAF